MPQIKPEIESFARIKVVGVGGGGINAVSHMVNQKIKGIDFIAINTDAQALHYCKASEKVLIGKNTTKGLGAGMNIELGRQACEESKSEIEEVLKGADMVFVTCGLGGGTGTSSSPIVAEIAKNGGALTIGIVTKPFGFEGKKRMELAEEGLAELKDRVDSIIVIPNDKILTVIDEKTTLLNAFALADNVLSQGVRAISDLIVMPGIVNVDFADVKAIMKDSGWALMGIGKAKGEGRIEAATKTAVNSPLLEVSIDGAKGVLFSIAGGEDLTMQEINQGADLITKLVDPDAKIIFGTVIDETLKKDEIKTTVIATGFNDVPEIKSKADNTTREEKRLFTTPKNIIKEEKIEEEDASEWDVPAFLRKKDK